jgi:plastocyanin
MRRLLLLLTAAATALALAVALPASGHHRPAKTITVKTGDDFFSPTSKTIHKRDIIKWVWVGADGKPGETINEHTIVEAKDRFSSKAKTSGTYKVRFKSAGKFTVYCGEHPETMKLTVKVKS